MNELELHIKLRDDALAALKCMSQFSKKSIEEYVTDLVQKDCDNFDTETALLFVLRDKGISTKTLLVKIVHHIYINLISIKYADLMELLKEDEDAMNALGEVGFEPLGITEQTLLPEDLVYGIISRLITKEFENISKKEFDDPVLAQLLLLKESSLVNQIRSLCLMMWRFNAMESYVFEYLLGVDCNKYNVSDFMKKVEKVFNQDEMDWFYGNYCRNLIWDKGESFALTENSKIMKILEEDEEHHKEIEVAVKAKLEVLINM